MFKTIFIKLCNERGESPTAVCLKVGLSNSAYTAWTDQSVPRMTTLVKLAEYFGVSVDYLMGREHTGAPFAEKSDGEQGAVRLSLEPLSPRELELVRLYRTQEAMRCSINKLLDVSEDETVSAYRAAQSEDDRPDEVLRVRTQTMDSVKEHEETEAL